MPKLSICHYLDLGSTPDTAPPYCTSPQFSGPGTVVVLLSPGSGLVLSSWSLTSQPKPRGSWRNGQVYHIQLVRGMGSQSQQFWLELEGRPGAGEELDRSHGAGEELEGRPGAGEELLTLSVAGHYNSGRDMVGDIKETRSKKILIVPFPYSKQGETIMIRKL